MYTTVNRNGNSLILHILFFKSFSLKQQILADKNYFLLHLSIELFLIAFIVYMNAMEITGKRNNAH